MTREKFINRELPYSDVEVIGGVAKSKQALLAVPTGLYMYKGKGKAETVYEPIDAAPEVRGGTPTPMKEDEQAVQHYPRTCPK